MNIFYRCALGVASLTIAHIGFCDYPDFFFIMNNSLAALNVGIRQSQPSTSNCTPSNHTLLNSGEMTEMDCRPTAYQNVNLYDTTTQQTIGTLNSQYVISRNGTYIFVIPTAVHKILL